MLMKDLVPSVIHLCYDDEVDIKLESKTKADRQREYEERRKKSDTRHLYEQSRAKRRSKQVRGKNLLKRQAKP